MRSEAMPYPNLNAWWACHLVSTLLERGVRHVCVSPGSRSTPLVFALENARQAGHVSLGITVHHDERAAGFFALGVAKASRQPVALVCTSGTALAHYFPAVIEASLTGVPLVVVSADRPLELRGSGASQTIDQHDLFGVHVRVSREFPAARADAVAVRRMRAIVAEAMARATGPDAGPVHLNVPFEDPLAPLPDPAFKVPEGSPFPLLEHERPSRFGPFTELGTRGRGRRGIPDGVDEAWLMELLFDWIRGRGLFIVGPQETPLPELVELARKLGWPILADVASQLRDDPDVFTTGDLLTRQGELPAGPFPSHLVQVGMVPTSSALARWIGQIADGMRSRIDLQRSLTDGVRHWVGDGGWSKEVIHIQESQRRQDPGAHAARVIVTDARDLFARMLEQFDTVKQAVVQREEEAQSWTICGPGYTDDELWHRQSDQAHVQLQQFTHSLHGLEQLLRDRPTFRSREAEAVHRACRILHPGSNLVLASSMPIRYAESLSGRLPRWTRVFVNRGANGIDGLVSTTLGVAHSGEQPTLAILGDVAMLHDVGGLIAVQEVQAPVVFLVLNNDGGGIFSHLPVHRAEPIFERFFGTPHGLNFGGAARMYGLRYTRTEEIDVAIRAVVKGLARETGATLVELVTDRATERDAFRQDLADLLGLEAPGEPRP